MRISNETRLAVQHRLLRRSPIQDITCIYRILISDVAFHTSFHRKRHVGQIISMSENSPFDLTYDCPPVEPSPNGNSRPRTGLARISQTPPRPHRARRADEVLLYRMTRSECEQYTSSHSVDLAILLGIADRTHRLQQQRRRASSSRSRFNVSPSPFSLPAAACFARRRASRGSARKKGRLRRLGSDRMENDG